MKTASMKIAAGLVVCVVTGTAANGARADEVTVTGSRFQETPVGINYTGIPIKDISLSTNVSVTDLDLSSAAGRAELDRRILAAARAACSEIGGMYPVSKPEGDACARTAVERSMSRMHKMLAASHRAPAG